MTHPACIITSVTCSTKFAPHVCVCVVPILPRSVRSGLVPKKNDLDGKWDRGHGRQGRRQENEGKGRPKKKKKHRSLSPLLGRVGRKPPTSALPLLVSIPRSSFGILRPSPLRHGAVPSHLRDPNPGTCRHRWRNRCQTLAHGRFAADVIRETPIVITGIFLVVTGPWPCHAVSSSTPEGNQGPRVPAVERASVRGPGTPESSDRQPSTPHSEWLVD